MEDFPYLCKYIYFIMYDQIREDTIYMMLYAVVTVMAALASIYLLFRRGNAFAADVTTPRRLRRWTAAFFAVLALGHLWYLPVTMADSSEVVMLTMLIGVLLDCTLTIPLAFVVMLCMLQDRRRPLWPVVAMMMPLVVVVLVCMVTRSFAYSPWLRAYFLLTVLGFTIYMACAVRQYGRWLRDNYADLEHKEVWQSFVVLAVIILLIGYYVVGYGDKAYEYIVQVYGLVLIGFLLWRVETLSDLSIVPSMPIAMEEETAPIEDMEEKVPSQTSYDFIAPLLQQYCVDTKLYLQHDLSVVQLAKTIGTNRLYLSQYFSCQGTTYNAYINDLRIGHFVSLYREAAADKRNVTAQQLANECGYRSYSTFTLAFKQRMGQSVTAWMREMD